MLAPVLPLLTALTSLDVEVQMSGSPTPAAATALLHGAAALPALQHLGLPHGLTITDCAPALNGLTALSSLRLHSLCTREEEPAAQLLSRIVRLQLSYWESRLHRHLGRAAWLAQLQELTVGKVDMHVLAALPPGVRIFAAPRLCQLVWSDKCLDITCNPDATKGEVSGTVARLQNSPAMKDSTSSLHVIKLRPNHCAAIKPLAESVSRVHGLQPSCIRHRRAGI